MEPKKMFDILLLDEAREFMLSQTPKVADKISYNLLRSRYFIDKELFKKLTDNIWEFRTLYAGCCYRLLAFWDKEADALVVATHGFQKKSQKTPPSEIRHAEEIRKQYFNDKND